MRSLLPGGTRKSLARASEGGLSLIEVMVALSLLGVGMLMTMALIAMSPQIRRRVDGHQEALKRIEMALEDIRANAWLPEDGEVYFEDWMDGPATPHLRVWAEVESLPEPRLYLVTVRATYQAGGRGFEQSIETMVWNARLGAPR